MKKSNLDEMQEQKMLHIEHVGCWLAFWCLVVSIVIQGLLGCYLDHILGEVISLFVLCIYMLFSCLKHGIWDRHLKPSWKNNLLCALAASLFMGVYTYVQLSKISDNTSHIFAACIITMIFIFAVCIAVLGLCSAFYKKRREKLDKE